MILRLPKPLNTDSFFLFGARGVGKSTFINEQFLKNHSPHLIWTIDLLNDDTFDRFFKRPAQIEDDLNALPEKPEWIFIDEIQKIPALLDHVHRLIEKKKQKFILSGSSARKLKKIGSNLLAGRAFLNTLFPLTHIELNKKFILIDALHWGTLPKVINSELEQKAAFLRSYVQVYIKEEILIEQLIRDLEPFRNFLEIAAQMNGKITNFTKIARDVNADPKTIENYYSILEDTYIGFYLPSFHRSIRKQQIQHPKFYFFDIGVKRALSRSLNDTFTSGSFAYGDAFEHLVIAEVFRLNQYFNCDYKLSHFRTKEGQEIDLILSRSQKLILIEIKSSDKVNLDDVEKFRKLGSEFKKAKLYFLSTDPHATEIDGVRCLEWRQGLKEILEIK
jgi:uncharacterized protein